MMFRIWGSATRAAAGIVAVGFALAAHAGARAWTTEEMPQAGGAAAPAPDDIPRAGARLGPDQLEPWVLRAVAADPFRPERTRPPDRYRLPGSAPAEDPVRTMPDRPELHVVGVAVGGGRGLAAVRISPGRTHLLRTDEEWEGYRLVAVTPDGIRLAGRDTTLVLPLPSPLEGGKTHD